MASIRLVLAVTASIALFLAAFASGTAHANSKYAAFVVHADTGDVLFDRYSNARRYPASLTKMMTVYMLFEAIEAGELSMDDQMKVSKRASGQPASKLGLKRGSKISVETAIDALVIKSANDVATVVAEELGGTESAFARKMTAKARELGMKRTQFRNASGLPNKRQVTTARDMAILSRRLIQDFPERFETFQRTSFEWNGRTYRSHNKVMLTLDGADGMKTGYTRASGYNLSTTIDRDGHRLIGVVLGGRSGATRDRHMKDILNTAYVEIARKPSLVNPIVLASPLPKLKPGARVPVRVAEAGLPMPSLRPGLVAPETSIAADLNLENLRVAIASVENDDRALDEAVFGEGDASVDESRDWSIQVGAYSRQPLAMARIEQVQDKVFGVQQAAGREVNITEQRGKNVFRARFTKLTAYEAKTACAELAANDDDCMALQAQAAR